MIRRPYFVRSQYARLLILAPCLLISLPGIAEEKTRYPIAGLSPDQRPVNAPVFVAPPVNERAWYERALHGVSEPYPKSLYFLDSQGNWYTPFNRPGMTGRYDLRGWHTSMPESDG